MRRATVARTAWLAGVDRLGRASVLTVAPSAAGHGVLFNGAAHAGIDKAFAEARTTCLGRGARRVGMVEHLLAACAGLGITDLLADVAGRELPFGDGSAMPYVRLLRRAGRRGLAADLPPIELRRPVAVGGGGFIIAVPARTLRISCLAGIPGQPAATVAVRPTGRQFEQELAPARTFGDSRLQPARLRRVLRLGFGLARIGRTVVPARSRLPDEACRHKLLDLLGDLWLLGRPLRAHLFAFRPGHELNLRFARALARDLEV